MALTGIEPNEHVDLGADPKHVQIKERFRRYLPTENARPLSMRTGAPDSHGRKVGALQKEGIPDWLGKVPETRNEETRQ